MICRFVVEPNRDRAVRWLDVGCGTGVLLDSYGPIQNKLGLETDAGSVETARSKGLDVRQVGPAWDFTEFGTFDLVTACDVIEHVRDDQSAVAAMNAVLNPGGIVLVTVPALMSLWSNHDVLNRHFRRYTRHSLLNVFDSARWELLRITYFSSFLLPVIWTVL